jgi:hypothetical protein
LTTARAVAWARGEDTPSDPESLGGDDEEEDEGREEGEMTAPPHSPLREALPSLGDIFSRQARIAVGACNPKWPPNGDQAIDWPNAASPPHTSIS